MSSGDISRERPQASGHLHKSEVRVLVVDDDTGVRKALCSLLESMSYATAGAADGLEAIEKLQEEHFDLVLLDLLLPNMKGEETFEKIKVMCDRIPVIIITAHGSIESSVELLRNGAVDYLTKPINLKEFRIRVRRALEEQRLKELAITDVKTQLYNYQYFELKMEDEVRRAKRYKHSLSLIMLDLDDFKDCNDTYGHLAGDAVLREMGSLLKTLVRECDIPCRFGGEEFSIILPETDLTQALKVAERIRLRIQHHRFGDDSGGILQKITISAGVTTLDPLSDGSDGFDVNLVIRHADKALYEAKRMGKNKACISAIP